MFWYRSARHPLAQGIQQVEYRHWELKPEPFGWESPCVLRVRQRVGSPPVCSPLFSSSPFCSGSPPPICAKEGENEKPKHSWCNPAQFTGFQGFIFLLHSRVCRKWTRSQNINSYHSHSVIIVWLQREMNENDVLTGWRAFKPLRLKKQNKTWEEE